MYARFHKPQRWQIWVALHGFAPPCYVLRSRCFFAPSTPAPTSCGAPVWRSVRGEKTGHFVPDSQTL